MRASAPALAGALALLAAGCGGGGAAGTTATRPLQLTAQERRGERLFVLRCGSCHTLAAAGTTGAVGPSFDTPWRASSVREAIADGPGLMPVNLVAGPDAAAVAAYVAAATAG